MTKPLECQTAIVHHAGPEAGNVGLRSELAMPHRGTPMSAALARVIGPPWLPIRPTTQLSWPLAPSELPSPDPRQPAKSP